MISSVHKTIFALAAILITLVVSGVLAWRFDLHEVGPEMIRSWGLLAMVGYALLMMILGGLGVPPVVFIIPATTFWSVPVAYLISLLGGFGASLVGFVLSRTCLRETLAPKIPEKIATYEHRLETHGISTVLILRLLFYLFPPVNWMLGISAISPAVFIGATLVGMLPGTLVYVLTGKGVVGFLSTFAPWQAGMLLLGVGVGLVAWWRWAVK